MSASTLRKIDSRMKELDPDCLRYHMLVALRRFRSSWVELGRLLTEVAYGGDYKDWGYDDFEVYCAGELGLKKPTTRKLMLSYSYMQKRAPERLAAYDDYEGDGPPPDVPDYQTVELLQKADDSDSVGQDDRQRFHRMAFDDGAEETDLRKEIRTALAPRQSEEDGDMDETKGRERELGDLRKTCLVLRRKLADSRHVPQGLRERFERLLAELAALE